MRVFVLIALCSCSGPPTADSTLPPSTSQTSQLTEVETEEAPPDIQQRGPASTPLAQDEAQQYVVPALDAREVQVFDVCGFERDCQRIRARPPSAAGAPTGQARPFDHVLESETQAHGFFVRYGPSGFHPERGPVYHTEDPANGRTGAQPIEGVEGLVEARFDHGERVHLVSHNAYAFFDNDEWHVRPHGGSLGIDLAGQPWTASGGIVTRPDGSELPLEVAVRRAVWHFEEGSTDLLAQTGAPGSVEAPLMLLHLEGDEVECTEVARNRPATCHEAMESKVAGPCLLGEEYSPRALERTTEGLVAYYERHSVVSRVRCSRVACQAHCDTRDCHLGATSPRCSPGETGTTRICRLEEGVQEHELEVRAFRAVPEPHDTLLVRRACERAEVALRQNAIEITLHCGDSRRRVHLR